MDEELAMKIQEAETKNAHNNHQESWSIINDITGRKKGKHGILEGKSKEERVQNWFNHFKELLGEEPIVEDEGEVITTVMNNIEFRTGEFDNEELQNARRNITQGKASGPDNIPPEVIKNCDMDEIILRFANSLLILQEKPEQWSIANIVPIPKKGDLSKSGNYRGISLSSIIAKLVNRMILNRIQPVLDPLLRTNQNGFRPGRSTISQILGLRRLIEGIKSKNLPSVILFLDFRKAFDSVHRGKMLKILKAYGLPNELVSTIGKMYENTRAKVISQDGETEEFDIVAGVLQGDTLAPYLFLIVLDYVLRQALEKNNNLGFIIEHKRSRRHPEVRVSDLDFADDIALTFNSIEEAQKALIDVEKAAAKVGLYLNAKKTEALIYNQDIVDIYSHNGEQIKLAQDFKYLGSWIDDSLKDIKTRKAQAWSACNKMKEIWRSNMNNDMKKRLFTITVESVLLYGCESWTMTKSTEKILDGAYTRLLRSALNISWRDHITNKELYGSLPKVSLKIKERRLKLSGHCVRHDEEVSSKLVLWQPSTGKRKRGRRKLTYIDTLLDDTGLETALELRSAMLNRSDWRKRIQEVRVGTRPK